MTLNNQSYSKLILIGEHSVLYNYKAIAIPFNAAKVEVEINEYEGLYVESSLYSGIFSEKIDLLSGLYQMLLKFQKDFNIQLNIKIKIISNLLQQRGMGSSAASSNAVLKAIANYYQINLDNEQLLKYVKVSEDIYHFKSSGIDAATVVYNKPILFESGKIKTFDFKLHGYLLVIDSNIVSNTKKAVLRVRKLKKYNLINKLGYLTEDFIKGMDSYDYQLINETIKNAQSILKQLGLSHKNIDEIVKMANDNHLSAKLTGGGLGGLVIVYSNNLDKLKQFQSIINYPSYDIIDLEKLND